MKIIKTELGCVSILAGKTDMGKSTISIFDAASNLRDGRSVLYFSYEYCQSIIYNKIVEHFHLKWQELFNLTVVDAAGLPLESMIETIRRKPNLDIVYVDYMDLVMEAVKAGTKTVSDVVAELAALAKELTISIVILARIDSNASIEETLSGLNAMASEVKGGNAIKMFIGRNDLFSSMVQCDDISHVILVDGMNLKHFSSINIKEAYDD